MTKTRYRYNLILTILLLTGFIFTSWFSLIIAKQSLFNGIENDALPLTSHLIHTDLQKQLQAPIIISAQMAHNTFLHAWLIDNKENKQLLFEYLRQTRREFGAVTGFLVTSDDQKYYRYDGETSDLDTQSAQDQWYQETLESPNPYTLNVDLDPRDDHQAVVFVNHKIQHKGQVLGVTGVGVKLDHLKRLIDKYQHTYDRKVYFIDHKGRLLFYNDSTFTDATLTDKFGIHSTKLLNQNNYKLRLEQDKKTIFINSRYLEQFGWYLVVEQTLTQDKSFSDTLYINLFMGVVITAVILASAQLTFNHYQKRLEKMATFDKLTNTHNRQAFEPLLQKALHKARTQFTPLTMLILDVDHFKQVNDEHGHLAGDKVLAQVAQVCKSVVKSRGVTCRWGGEEFVILLPKTTLDNGYELAQQIHDELNKSPCEVKVTASIGIAQYHVDESEDGLLKRADAALYRAKSTGRNRTVLAEAA
ncbi:sensor domain-containing diguanylate cyclase [Pseudoalteromonas luteoviolacea]|uniref:sensor domain-containing diguanylate cyclase n=1 Tax=Pseudoalteromonas luteoviolacea TaxID=43657 RepID=UPI00115146CE|nr:sensor domain-containing diguanylate cyclase [Pseudoalteromonas luteoviolacea]TQF72492.1 diguanylate cyclase [Pseudoalteromonas luteoviolacea]